MFKLRFTHGLSLGIATLATTIGGAYSVPAATASALTACPSSTICLYQNAYYGGGLVEFYCAGNPGSVFTESFVGIKYDNGAKLPDSISSVNNRTPCLVILSRSANCDDLNPVMIQPNSTINKFGPTYNDATNCIGIGTPGS